MRSFASEQSACTVASDTDLQANGEPVKNAYQANAVNNVELYTIDLKNGTNIGNDYVYDANDNLIKDLNKNITDIQYNVLNLPSKVTFGNGNSVSYMYAANGKKL